MVNFLVSRNTQIIVHKKKNKFGQKNYRPVNIPSNFHRKSKTNVQPTL